MPRSAARTAQAQRKQASKAALFPLGSTSVTPGAQAALAEAAAFADDLFLRHQTGDFGKHQRDEQQEAAIRNGWRVFSQYVLHTGEEVMVVTEAGRDRTECMLPGEFFSPVPEQAPAHTGGYRVDRWRTGRYWAVFAPDGTLISVCVYHKGAANVAGFLAAAAGLAPLDGRPGQSAGNAHAA